MAPVKYPRLEDAEWLRRVYVGDRRTTMEIAEVLGCKAASVSAALKRHGIPARPRNGSQRLGYRRQTRVRRAVRDARARDRQAEVDASRTFPSRVEAVNSARDPATMRAALVDLAALCEEWARHIPQTRVQVRTELRLIGGQIRYCRCDTPLPSDDEVCVKCGRRVAAAA